MNIKMPEQNNIKGLIGLWKEAFGDSDEFINIFMDNAFSFKRSRVVINNFEVAGALYWFECFSYQKPIAYIYAVATLKKYQGHGVCSALMQDTHNLLLNMGYEGIVLVPGSESLFNFYEKMGYKTCCYIDEFSCLQSSNKLQLTSISKDEFKTLRRQYIPYGGVIQENENIDFLSKQVKFYKGADFLLAARKEKDTLFGVEILGNTKNASEIVNTLGCLKGTFRTPGTKKPFAMYYDLSGNSVPPKYFGFAFD